MSFLFDTGATDILDGVAAKQLGVAVEGALPGGGFGDQIASFGLARVKSAAGKRGQRDINLTLADQV